MFGFMYSILEFKDRYFEGLFLDFSETYINGGELLFVFGFFNQPEVSFEVALVLLLVAQLVVPGDQQIVQHQLGHHFKHSPH